MAASAPEDVPMRWRALGSVAVAALVVCLSAPAVAQEKDPAAKDPTMEVLREKVRADKKVVIMSALELTDEEAKGFWPVYGAYQSDMITHYDRVGALLRSYISAYPNISDEAAKKLVTEFIALETDHAALLKRYAPRFEKVLPPRKVARFYQVENKIRALVAYDLAREIPLVK
jgi:hypothetical protein